MILHRTLGQALSNLAATLFLLLGAVVLPTSKLEGQQEKAANQDLLAQIAEHTASILRLELEGGNLVCRFPSREEAEPVMTSIRSITGGGGGSSFGGERWEHRSYGAQARVTLGRGPQRHVRQGNASELHAHFFEVQHPGRFLMLDGEGERAFTVTYFGGPKDLLYFRQLQDGSVQLQRISEDGCSVLSAGSFRDLWLRRPDLVEEQLLSVLSTSGLGMPPSVYSREVAEQVVAQLGFSEKAWDEFSELLERFDAPSFREREDASRELVASFDTWREAIRVGIDRKSLSIETRSRLRKIYNDHAGQEAIRVFGVIESLSLLERPDYLVRLAMTLEPATAGPLAERLGQITGKDHGTDWQAWQTTVDQAASTPVAEAVFPTEADEPGTPGPLQQNAVEVSRLVQLTIIDNQLRLDRGAWNEFFGGKPVATLLEEVQAAFDSRNLPDSWLNMGDGYAIERIDHAHLLFQRIHTEFEKQAGRNSMTSGRTYFGTARNQSLNRQVDGTIAYCELQMHETERTNKPLPAEFFRLMLREKASNGSLLWLEERADSLYLLLLASDTDSIIELSQEATGECRVHVIAGGQAETRSGVSPVQLYEQNKSYFHEDLYPRLAKLGVNVSLPLGGPLKVVNASRANVKGSVSVD